MLDVLHRVIGSGTVRRRKLGDFQAPPDRCAPGPDSGEIERAFFTHDGPVVHKWHQYLPVYDRHFAEMRDVVKDRPLRFLEIGVSLGGSLGIWRKFFGPEAVIFGIDIDPACARLDGVSGGSVRIGSQDDPDFLGKVIAEMGGEVDIVLDDGSHMAKHMNRSFEILFPHLADRGIYVVEDLQCAYWSKFGGGFRRPASFIETAKRLVDDMHAPYHAAGRSVPAAAGQIAGVHFYDAILVIEKNAHMPKPVQSKQGTRR